MTVRVLLVVVTVAAAGCFRTPPPPPEAGQLLTLMNRRLALMPDVARAKWNAKSPIADPAREADLLRELADAGRGHGLDPASTAAFFTAQIEAAKVVQAEAFRRWEADGRGPFPDPPDLRGDLRPKIDRLNRDLLAALAAYTSRPAAAADVRRLADQRLTAAGVTVDARAAAVAPLLRVP